jgi:NAD(P)-dependent dehydrogenase (short-subunit alcohol dehydrogenase family)
MASVDVVISIRLPHEDWPTPGEMDYCLARGGRHMLTRTAGVAFARHSVPLVVVGPGAVAMPINLGTVRDGAKRAPLGRTVRPKQVATVVSFLAEDNASYLTTPAVFAEDGIMQSSVSR